MAEMDLDKLIEGMSPRLDNRAWVYAKLPANAPSVAAIMWFEEAEGTTVILDSASAREAGLEASPPFALITLTVHSDLAAVGFIAKVTSALADAGIGTNVVAAFHHDHIFVPKNKALRAMDVLERLIKGESNKPPFGETLNAGHASAIES